MQKSTLVRGIFVTIFNLSIKPPVIISNYPNAPSGVSVNIEVSEQKQTKASSNICSTIEFYIQD